MIKKAPAKGVVAGAKGCGGQAVEANLSPDSRKRIDALGMR